MTIELLEKTKILHHFPTPPELFERPTQSRCPHCSRKLLVYKTRQRTVYTLRYGPIQIHITILACEIGHPRVILEPEHLQQLVPKYATYGLDVTVWIGLQRFREGKRIASIKAELKSQGISVCENTVVNHSIRFLAYFLCVHRESAPELANALQMMGGYILQFDSSSEEDSQKLLLYLEGVTGIVLDAVHSPVADYDHYRPVLEWLKAAYGDPLQLVSDLGKAETKAANLIFPGILHRLCHYHFLRAVGEAILQADYDRFRTRLKKKGKRLEKLRKSVHKLVEEATEGFRSELTNTALLEVYLFLERLFHHKKAYSGLGFPFDLQAVDFYTRCLSVAELVRTSVQLNADRLVISRSLLRLATLLQELLADTELKELYSLLVALNEPFQLVRELFHLKPQKIPLSDTHELYWCDFVDLRMAAMRLIKRFRRSLPTVPVTYRQAYETVIDYLRKYWSKLFCQGVVVHRGFDGDSHEHLLPRTNNAVEQKFRSIKRFIRRICGKKRIGSELDTLGKGIALTSNLAIPLYVEEVYGLLDVDALCHRFSQLPHAKVRKVEQELLAECRGLKQFRIGVRECDRLLDRLMDEKRTQIIQRACRDSAAPEGVIVKPPKEVLCTTS